VLALKLPRERSLKEGFGVKKHLAAVVFVFFLLGTAHVSDALTFTFDDTQSGLYSFKATLEVTITGKQLTAVWNNISSEYFDTKKNSPAINGFGFTFLPYSSPKYWQLDAYDDKDNKSSAPLLARGEMDPGIWHKTANSKLGDVAFQAGVQYFDGLFSPKLSNANQDARYFSTAIFLLEFDNEIKLENLGVPVIQVVYDSNQNSLDFKYVKGVVAAPEPGTMLLLGLGLIGIAVIMREIL
jgi:hypothetical protein